MCVSNFFSNSGFGSSRQIAFQWAFTFCSITLWNMDHRETGFYFWACSYFSCYLLVHTIISESLTIPIHGNSYRMNFKKKKKVMLFYSFANFFLTYSLSYLQKKKKLTLFHISYKHKKPIDLLKNCYL